MNHINITSKETQEKVDLHISKHAKGRWIPVTKAINNWIGSKLPWKWSKFNDISPPYIYWTRSYKWFVFSSNSILIYNFLFYSILLFLCLICSKFLYRLANAFWYSTPGMFKVKEWKELTKLIKAFNKCSKMHLK